jgi:hypothetical protein
LLCTSSAITLFFILWNRSIVLVRIILWINSQGNYNNYFSLL